MVYERLGIKKEWDGKKEYRSEKNPEKKEGKSGRYTEILQIFHMTVMILGIFMEKISRVQAMGGKRAGIFAAYAAAGKGSWICRNKVRYIVNKNGSGHAVAAVAGGLAGLYYGVDAIPKEWLDKIMKKEYVEELCEKASFL